MLIGNISGTIRKVEKFEDFKNVFQVFASGPFFEAWTDDLMLDAFNKFSVKDAAIFGFFLDSDNTCVSIVAIRPPTPEDHHPVEFPDDYKTMYLSDIATLDGYRRNGIGMELLQYALRHTKVLGYNNIYLRTNEKSWSWSYSIAKKAGFNQIPDLCQEVSFPRTNSYVNDTTDLRIFMARKL